MPPDSPSEEIRPTSTPAGWYPFPENNLRRWWDGTAWGVYAPAPTGPRAPVKDTGVAYLLLILLGGFGAHLFYLNRIGSAITLIILWWGGWLTSFIYIGFVGIAAVIVWWIVDLFMIPSYVREANKRAG